MSGPPSSEDALRQAQGLIARRAFKDAFDLCAGALRRDPNHPGLTFTMARLYAEAADLARATQFATHAARLAPQNALYAAFAARCAVLTGDTDAARAGAEHTASLAPREPHIWDMLGFVFTRLNLHDRALDAAQRAVAAQPNAAQYWLNLAAAQVVTGDIAEAASAYERAIALDPDLSAAYVSLVQISPQSPERNYTAQLERLLGRAADPGEALELAHALGKSYEDMGEYMRAMEAWRRGKSLARRASRYDSAQEAPIFEAAMRSFDDAAPGEGYDAATPIFVVGLPRTGTTLTDRILSSHPDVASGGELPSFPDAAHRLATGGAGAFFSADVFSAARRIDVAVLGRAYDADARHRVGGGKRILDKLPVNILYAGLIHRALPNARIVCLRRDPMDSVLSNFRQLFSQRQPLYHHSYDIEDAARYYVLFDRIVAHWRNVLPADRFTETHYETLVTDQERETRRLVAFCGLAWDELCLRFEVNQQPVTTPSAAQVREKANTRALARWRRYGALLDPARKILDEAGLLGPEHAI